MIPSCLPASLFSTEFLTGKLGELVDETMITDVLAGFQQMHATRMAVLGRAFPVGEMEVFEEII